MYHIKSDFLSNSVSRILRCQLGKVAEIYRYTVFVCKATVEGSQKLYLSLSAYSLQNVSKEDQLLRVEVFFVLYRKG